MRGGGTGRCLQTTEAGGLGEGWSDAMAQLVGADDDRVPDYVKGQYLSTIQRASPRPILLSHDFERESRSHVEAAVEHARQ
ncbi:hypothetical protein A0H81_02730 [Grifola frondosa]|uniref:Extracellular metalloproteinase n=1 Tax=Grifola frondosa TaxID=5627 RepID=A0A1C7MMC1_GRIFR|nr:hypothetical protein A0H81_02730 [Grifola frondosa]